MNHSSLEKIIFSIIAVFCLLMNCATATNADSLVPFDKDSVKMHSGSSSSDSILRSFSSDNLKGLDCSSSGSSPSTPSEEKQQDFSDTEITTDRNRNNPTRMFQRGKIGSLSMTIMPILKIPRKTRIILTIDGGGSRGIIPVFFLNELQRRLSHELGYTVDELPIDMYVGTSVGGLVATALITGRIREMYSNYMPIARKIFVYKWWKWLFTKIFRGYTYESGGRAEIIEDLANEEVEGSINADLVIPFCSAKTHDIFKYRSYDDDSKFSLYDALMASSAAPTYFAPHVFTGKNGNRYEGTDGGICANHPGDIALDEARKRYPGDIIVMISLGTGHSNATGSSTYGLNLFGWAHKISDLFLELQSKRTNATLINLSESTNHKDYFHYIRINPFIGREHYTTDDTSIDHMEHLENIARQSIERDGSERMQFEKVVNIMKHRIKKRNKQE